MKRVSKKSSYIKMAEGIGGEALNCGASPVVEQSGYVGYIHTTPLKRGGTKVTLIDKDGRETVIRGEFDKIQVEPEY